MVRWYGQTAIVKLSEIATAAAEAGHGATTRGGRHAAHEQSHQRKCRRGDGWADDEPGHAGAHLLPNADVRKSFV